MNFRGADRLRTMNSYLNALRWTVDEFWRALLPALAATGRDVLVVYTSDHGQSILEENPATGRPELLSHNTPQDPPSYQAMVPVFAVAIGDGARGWLREHFDPELSGRLDHFALFPTLLLAAGYDEASVRERFGPTLFDPAAVRKPRLFGSGDHFGRSPFAMNRFDPSPRPLPEGLRPADSAAGP
jgi:arylsulfatase A-like enzyme